MRCLLRTTQAWCFLVACALFGLIGCGDGKPRNFTVSGRVTLDGQPLADASVAFVPDGNGQPAHGQSDKDGVYTLATGMQPGVGPGRYKIVVTKDELPPMDPSWTPQQKMEARLKASKSPGKSLVPKAYTAAATTPLTCTVPVAEGKFDVELKSAP